MKIIHSKYKGLLPLILLSVFCIYNFAIAFFPIIGTDTYAILNIKHYLAGVAIVIDLILFFSYRPIYKYALLITLLAGTFGIINFMHSQTYINIGPLSIGFHITPLLIGLFTILLYSGRFKQDPVDESGVPFERTNAESAQLLGEEIEKFKLRFKDKSAETLTELCSDTRYSFAAKEAAKQILAERSKTGG